MNVGLDLELWPFVPPRENARPQLLFVGGNFQRKGGDRLLDAWRARFSRTADLHLVTKEPPAHSPSGVSVYTDLEANDPRLRELYARCDIFVLPTRADLSPWVAMEAAATGRPVVISRSGGTPDLVVHGESGLLLEQDDARGLEVGLASLIANRELRLRMGMRGRALVEDRFNAAKNVPLIFAAMKRAVDLRRNDSSR